MKLLRQIDAAINIALCNTSKQRFGCVALNKSGHIIASGQNSPCKTHPIQANFSKKYGNPQAVYLHAEIATMIKAKSKIHTLIVVRLLADNTPGLARPCKICSSAINISGIKNVIYSNEFGNFTFEKR